MSQSDIWRCPKSWWLHTPLAVIQGSQTYLSEDSMEPWLWLLFDTNSEDFILICIYIIYIYRDIL